ncbi:MAG TPA: [dimethylamine--corrinoid protein] Co-methyltransferase, partial [Thermoleophilia bacterium]|nr:[dimethylamine--corrinoid protein] Co-methyltransferase [Thermoleophilia bacterium]
MEAQVPTRMGDGSLVTMSRSQIRTELDEGTTHAAAKGKLPPLDDSELDHLLDIFASRARFTGVDIGDEVVLSKDGTGTPQLGSRVDALYIAEQVLGHDTCELFHIDYSYKAVKPVVAFEQQLMKEAQERVTIPVHYGAQPDLGRYSRPDGPCGNWSELLPELRIDEARAAQEEAVELAVEDMVFVAESMWQAGADGINFDTAGAAGDGDFLATLLAVERLRARHPDMGIMVGMAGEIVLGTHGRLEYRGTRLAGLKPAGQLRVVTQAGATVYGPAVNVNTSRSVAWNTARALTWVKPCMADATIPVHLNVGMGVGGIPMHGF